MNFSVCFSVFQILFQTKAMTKRLMWGVPGHVHNLTSSNSICLINDKIFHCVICLDIAQLGQNRFRNWSKILTLVYSYIFHVGLDWTGHISFLTRQDRTPKFSGQVLPDRTESGLLFPKHFTCQAGDISFHKISFLDTNLLEKMLIDKISKEI